MRTEGKVKIQIQKRLWQIMRQTSSYASTENEERPCKGREIFRWNFLRLLSWQGRGQYRGIVFLKVGLSRKRDKRNDFSFGEQRQDLYPSADTRAVQRVCELSGILKRRMVLQITLKHKRTMYNEEEQATDIIGCSCTLLTPYKGYTEGRSGWRLWLWNSGKAQQRQRSSGIPGRGTNLWLMEDWFKGDTDSRQDLWIGDISRTFNPAK